MNQNNHTAKAYLFILSARCLVRTFCLLALCIFIFSTILTSCSAKKDTSADSSETEWDLTDITNRLKTEITYTDSLEEMAPDLMDYLYGAIDAADVKEQIIYISSGSTSEEIAAFKAVDEDAAKRIEEGLHTRILEQTESFTDYVPEEVKRLSDAVLVRNGIYVVLSVSGDPKTAKDILGK